MIIYSKNIGIFPSDCRGISPYKWKGTAPSNCVVVIFCSIVIEGSSAVEVAFKIIGISPSNWIGTSPSNFIAVVLGSIVIDVAFVDFTRIGISPNNWIGISPFNCIATVLGTIVINVAFVDIIKIGISPNHIAVVVGSIVIDGSSTVVNGIKNVF